MAVLVAEVQWQPQVVRAFQAKATAAVPIQPTTQQVAVAVVVLAVLALTHQTIRAVLVEQQARTVTQAHLLVIRVVVVVVVLRQAQAVALTQVMVAVMRQALTQPLIVAVEVAVLAVRTTAATAAQVVSSCVGSPQTQQASQSASQARQRTELTVPTLGMRGIQQELWWWRNGTLRKSCRWHGA
jgi:hypothetical protein